MMTGFSRDRGSGPGRGGGSPLGLHRVLEPAGVLPQAAARLDASPAIWPDEVRVAVTRLNLDAASFRQLRESTGGSAAAMRSAVLGIVASRGKMQNPVTGSGGMLTGVVAEVGPDSPLGLAPGNQIASLVSLSLTPLVISDGLARWDGQSEQVPCTGHAILFGRSIAAVLPADLPDELALAVLDVCGAPALTQRVVGASPGERPPGTPRESPARRGHASGAPRLASEASPGERPPGTPRESPVRAGPVVAILGAGGKSGSLSAAAARRAGARAVIGVVPTEHEATAVRAAGLADQVVIADARDPVGLGGAVQAAGGPADVTVVCVDVPGCEGGAVLATAPGGTVIFFSMATSFSAAALGAEGLAADVTMLIGNGYVPGHAALALDLIRAEPGVRRLFEARLGGHEASQRGPAPAAGSPAVGSPAGN